MPSWRTEQVDVEDGRGTGDSGGVKISPGITNPCSLTDIAPPHSQVRLPRAVSLPQKFIGITVASDSVSSLDNTVTGFQSCDSCGCHDDGVGRS